MDASDGDGQQRPGLRQRKKEKTRQLIQEAAVRLFEERGYQDTSIQAIADTAEVSPATVVRYFPEKSDLVIYDDLDEQLIDAIRAQPAEVNILQAVRNAVREVFGGLGERDVAVWRQRERLMWAEPELRAAMLGDLMRTEREMVGWVADRLGRPADDPKVLAIAGAGIGVSLAAWYACEGEQSLTRYAELFDAALSELEPLLEA